MKDTFSKLYHGFTDIVRNVLFVASNIGELTRALAFLGTLGVTLYMYVAEIPVPDTLIALTGLFAGYYFRGMDAGKGTITRNVHIEGSQ